jgi:ketosteroid isomerase-like protein
MIRKPNNHESRFAIAPFAVTVPVRWAAALALVWGCLSQPARGADADDVRATVESMAREWNKGSVDGYLDGYWHGDQLRVTSCREVMAGWDAVRRHYKDGYPAGSMGTLNLSGIDIELPAPDIASVFVHWSHQAAKHRDGVSGLLLRKTDVGWKVISEHTYLADGC